MVEWHMLVLFALKYSLSLFLRNYKQHFIEVHIVFVTYKQTLTRINVLIKICITHDLRHRLSSRNSVIN